MIRVLLVDDQPLLRSGLRILLDAQEDIVVEAEANDGAEAVALARKLRPDVVLMDICMTGVDGVTATREILYGEPQLDQVRVLILTTFDTDENVFGALRAGASGFMAKDAEPAELAHAIRVVARGDALLSPGAARRLIADFAARPERGHAAAKQIEWLTEREREVVALVAAGLKNDEIADRLVISGATAKTHVSRAMRKLQVHDRAQLVAFAYLSGLVCPGRRQQVAP